MIAAPAARRPEGARVPPELLGSVPRDVRLTGGGIAVASIAGALAAGALVVAILLSVGYVRSEDERRARQRDGATTDADVVQVVVGRGEHPRRIATYGYSVDGRRYTARTTLRTRDRDVERGSTIRVRYLASRPGTSWRPGDEPPSFPVLVIPLAAIGLLLTAVAVAWSVRRQWVLLSEGRVAQARVTATKKVNSDHGRRYRVSYEFRTLSGATQTSRCDVGKTPPPIGTVLPIVYHRDTPQWSAIYPLQLVRPGRLVN